MSSLISFLDFAVQIYTYVIIARILLSWFPLPSGETMRSIWNFIYSITEPFLSIFRRLIPPLTTGGIGIDLSPIIAILVLGLGWNIIRSILVSALGA